MGEDRVRTPGCRIASLNQHAMVMGTAGGRCMGIGWGEVDPGKTRWIVQTTLRRPKPEPNDGKEYLNVDHFGLGEHRCELGLIGHVLEEKKKGGKGGKKQQADTRLQRHNVARGMPVRTTGWRAPRRVHLPAKRLAKTSCRTFVRGVLR